MIYRRRSLVERSVGRPDVQILRNTWFEFLFSASKSFAPSVIDALNQSLRGGGYKTEVRPSLRFLIILFPRTYGEIHKYH